MNLNGTYNPYAARSVYMRFNPCAARPVYIWFQACFRSMEISQNLIKQFWLILRKSNNLILKMSVCSKIKILFVI